MDHLDLSVLKALLRWRSAGQRALLATVVRTWGSSPRPVGSIMALCEDGSVVGSVSGGCIEDDLIHRFTRAYAAAQGLASTDPQEIPQGPPRTVRYGVTADEAHRFGLPCGGTLELMLEFDPQPQALADLVDALGRGQLVQRTLHLGTGEVTLARTDQPATLQWGGETIGATVSATVSETGGETSAQTLVNTFGPGWRLLLIGAGQMAEYLATMALFSGFSVTVCDPREEYRGSWSVAGVNLSHDMPDDEVLRFAPDARSAVVALTHDPKLDDLALLQALASPAFYVGAIGSRRNNEARRARMCEHFGHTPESLARLRGPIGVYIGSKTPAEIAVSIMAELIAVKNGVSLPRDVAVAHAKDAMPSTPASGLELAPVCGSGPR